MAENKEVLSKFEEQIQCPVCLDTFTSPKLLQCHHVYCRGCLVKLVERDEQGQLVLSCPNCRKITPVPANGVSGLQPAFQTNNLLEIRAPLKKALSQTIIDDDSEIKDSPVTPAPSKILSYCSEHANEETKLYCEDCKEFACVKCVVSSARHHSHSYKLLDSYREDILSSLEPVRDQLSVTSNAATQIDTHCAEISVQQASIEARIDQAIGQLHEMLDIRKAELKSQLHYLAECKLKSLATQKDQIMKTHAQLERCESDLHEKLQQLRDDREIVRMKQSMTTQMSELTSTFQSEAMKPVTSADMELKLEDNLPELCRNYGALLADELLPEPSKCFIMNTGNESSTPVEISVKAIDHFGNPCLGLLTPLCYEIVSEIKGVEIRDQREGSNGHYTVTFTPSIKGRHQLRANINSQEVSGSPFTVHVKSSVESLGGQIACINGVSRPWGIVVNKKREIIVSESNKHRISVYSTSGRKLRSFGTQGSSTGQFKSPRGLALDDSGNIVVADHGNHRIQMFTDNGQFLRAVSSFKGPNAVAFNARNQRFYAVDDEGVVCILTTQLAYYGTFGGKSSLYKEGKFSVDTYGISCDSSGQVYVADSVKHKVQVFSAEGVFLRVLQGRQFNSPVGIAFDTNDIMHVSNRYGHNVQVLSVEGKLLKTVAVNVKGQGELNYPRNIAVDEYGIVYVCDNNNDRVCLY